MKYVAVGLFAVLPLQWFVIASTPLGTGRLHQLAILGFTGLVLLHYRSSAYMAAVGTSIRFVIPMVYMLLAWGVVDMYNGKLPFGSVQQFLYLGACLAIATFVYKATTSRDQSTVHALRWAAAAAVASAVIGFSLSMAVNGVNPAAVMQSTVAAADPEIFQKQVFQSSFAGFGLDEETARGNLRHEIFGAVLLAMLVSSWAMRFGGFVTRRQRIGYRVAMTVGVVLLTLSLSRSILIAAILWPVVALIRSLRSGRLSGRQVALAYGTVTAVGLLSLSGFGLVLWNRFTTETTGYDARAENYTGAMEALQAHWLTGGVQTAGLHVSSHNFVLDSWMRGGIFTAIPAAAVVVVLALMWFGLVARLHVTPEWMTPVCAALALPLVRLVTAGGGLIPPIEWVALGFVFGILAMRNKPTPRMPGLPFHRQPHVQA